MSAILDFPLHRVGPVSVQRPGASAEVVIFPGVRIERQEPAAGLAGAARSRRGSAGAAQEIETF